MPVALAAYGAGPRLDRVTVAVGGDRDPVWLGLLGDWDGQPQYPSVVLGLHPVSIQVVPEEQLPAEHAARALGGDHLSVRAVGDGALSLYREHVALDVEVDVLGLHP